MKDRLLPVIDSDTAAPSQFLSDITLDAPCWTAI